MTDEFCEEVDDILKNTDECVVALFKSNGEQAAVSHISFQA